MKKNSPLQQVKQKYGSKSQLVSKVVELLEPNEDETKDDFAARLKYVANRKLLRLVQLGEKARALGGKTAIIEKIAELKQQVKDQDFKAKLRQFSLGRLIDLQTSLLRRKKASSS